MSKIIGKIAATEKIPTTIEEFCFWTDQKRILHPFDVVKVEHINQSITFGVIEEISHITDAASYLTSFISSDFGDVNLEANTHRIGMNFVKAKVVSNTKDIYTPVLDGQRVSLATQAEVSTALGLDKIEHPLPCGYLQMYEGEDKIVLPVHFNSHFVVGPDGAHLNISGISGLAAKTSYAMFLLKAIQEKYVNEIDVKPNESTAFVIFNVKGRDLLAIDEANEKLPDEDKKIYEMLKVDTEPFKNVQYFYPHFNDEHPNTYAHKQDVKYQIDQNKAFKYKFVYEYDRESLELLFANVDDSTGTMDSIINYVLTDQGNFGNIRNWSDFLGEVDNHINHARGGEITVMSWRKFKRIVRKSLTNSFFANRISEDDNEIRLPDAISRIRKNDVFVVDIARLDEDMQSFAFGNVIKAIYDLKLGQAGEQDEIPKKIIIFVDELNKYASQDAPKNSPILKQVRDITERGRSLGIILFSAEQFKSSIDDRVKGNCSTHAYGRTNAIEISKGDYRYIPQVYRGMMTRLKQGEYIVQNPVFTSPLNIKFPNPVYKQFPNG